jgi:hypothetical protein
MIRGMPTVRKPKRETISEVNRRLRAFAESTGHEKDVVVRYALRTFLDSPMALLMEYVAVLENRVSQLETTVTKKRRGRRGQNG